MTVAVRDDNLGAAIAAYLGSQWGFEADLKKFAGSGTFLLRIDGQHAATVDVSPWSEKPPGGEARAMLSFGLARRDINELWAEVLNPNWTHVWHASLQESTVARFFDQPIGFWFWDPTRWTSLSNAIDDFGVVTAWCDEWVSRLVGEAACLSWISEYLEKKPVFDSGTLEQQAKNAKSHAHQMAFRRMLNHMLNGWTDADSAEFLEPMRADLERLPPEHKFHQSQASRLLAIEAWVAKHPNGINRELTD